MSARSTKAFVEKQKRKHTIGALNI